ncbi:PREDICTED: uncharacterized protein LOC104819267 [Tarenaya hassleriana]|uniref:uncharacterized protein LOC104819267 n=1 Tax=Tarenaya hassleriana TaxID=28532 RepID=UPI00053C5E38|nr:PREDICTED: uncharacterized protein LOC104819267 [Tarenaya hassleriana]
MGNCQAAEAATVVIHNPTEKKVERVYWSVSASDVMGSHPGHYVAMVITSPTLTNDNGSPLKHLKLLRPHDTLLLGHVYRLVSFEEVLNEFAAKKCVKLGKLLREGGGLELKKKKEKNRDKPGRTNPDPNPNEESDRVENHMVAGEGTGVSGVATGTTAGSGGFQRMHGGTWRPSLHSIPEIEVS